MNCFADLAQDFLDKTAGRGGGFSRPNDTFFSVSVVAESLHFIRGQMLRGASLTDAGERFVASAAAYLGYLSYINFSKRGFDVVHSAQWQPQGPENHVVVGISRNRNGTVDNYAQDFLANLHEVILTPPRSFPSMRGRVYILESLSIPTVEYLYLLGVFFTLSPLAGGNWPQGETAGSLDEDFNAARQILVSDFLKDIRLDEDYPGFRSLAHWIVWPPYGWDMNDGQDYNMMTLVDQIFFRKIVSLEEGESFLRAMLYSQLLVFRNLAARTLLVLGFSPRDPVESAIFNQARHSSDQDMAGGSMIRFRWLVTGNTPQTQPTEEFVEESRNFWNQIMENAPQEPWRSSAIMNDPLYWEISELGPDRQSDKDRKLEELMRKHPGEWLAEVAYGFNLLQGKNPGEGEKRLCRAMESDPLDTTAHFSLAGWYHQNGRDNLLDAIYLDAVRRWPWNTRTTGNAMWSLTRNMVAMGQKM